MIENKRIETEYASLTPANDRPLYRQNAYNYDLAVPRLLSKDQMELILRMVSQMKEERPHLDGLKYIWMKDALEVLKPEQPRVLTREETR